MKVSWPKLLRVLGVLFGVYLIISLTPLSGLAKNTLSFVLTPIFKVTSGVTKGVSDFFGAIFSIEKLQKENEQLQKRIAELEGENAKLIEAKKENEQLRSALSFQEKSGGKLLPAQIIGKDPGSFLQEILIDKGTASGVRKGMAVVYGGILVGKVSEVAISSSRVTLIISPKSVVPAMTQEGRVLGVVRGQMGYGLVLEDVSIEEKILVGERLISSSLGNEYPQGLILGDVEKVETDQNKIFQTAQVRIPLNFKKLEQVFVMIK